jgi:hypothetical protein
MALAVDGDIIGYRVAAVCEEDFAKACNSIMDEMLNDIVLETQINDMRIYLSGKNNFRYDVAVTRPYKGNREGKVKPIHLSHCYDYLRTKYRAITVDGYEADDAIASDMVQNSAVHCGIDKDIQQIAGRHYNFVTKEMIVVSDAQAKLNMFRQICTGDGTDNIPGLPLIGEKKAEAAISDYVTAAADAYSLYEEVCAKKLPDVDVDEYFNEQSDLIELRTDLKILDMVTNKLECSFF